MLIGAVLYFFLLIDAAAHSLLVTVLAYSRNNLDAVNLEVYASYISRQAGLMTEERRTVRFATSDASDEFKTGVRHTPRITNVAYKRIEERQNDLGPIGLTPSQQGSISKPNTDDILRRVSLVIHQHIIRCEERMSRVTPETSETGLFHTSKLLAFSEDNFVTPQYEYHFLRVPICRLGLQFSIREVKKEYTMPTSEEVHLFVSDLFKKAQLSAECSIICLIYVERLMEVANVPIVTTTWRPCLLCGLLLASKVWQDLSSWNSEIAQIYPQFPLPAINKLESQFCQEIKWDLYISSSSYAKYYFALRSLTEKKDFRANYNAMLLNAPNAKAIEERSTGVKQQFLSTVLSKSL